MNANYKANANTAEKAYLLGFIAEHGTDTITIAVSKTSGMSTLVINKDIGMQKELLKAIAKSYGWDSWLKIKVDYLN